MDEPGAYLRSNITRRTRRVWLLMTAYLVALVVAVAAGLGGHWVVELVLFLVVACFGVAANDTITATLPWIYGDRAEASVRGILEELRRDDYLVVHDVMFGGMGNLDHLVVGSNNAFLIETKTSRYELKHLGRVKHQAKLLHGELGAWVAPVICAGSRRSKTYEHKGVLICGRNNIVDAIRARPTRGAVDIERVRRFVDRFAV